MTKEEFVKKLNDAFKDNAEGKNSTSEVLDRTETFLSQGCTWSEVLSSLGLIASMAHIENPGSRLRDNLYLELTRIVGEYCTDLAEGEFQDPHGKYKNSDK